MMVAMETGYAYFSRDVSWLSFNHRVLLEAKDGNLPIYERLKFLSIHASNLEEFYKIRVAEHRSVIMKKVHSEEDPAESQRILEDIKAEVTRQQQEFAAIFRDHILPELEAKGICLYMDGNVREFHREFVRNYFKEEVFPYLQPVMLLKDRINVFLRDNRLYQVTQLRGKSAGVTYYALNKIPYAKIPRFIELPFHEGKHYYMFAEDLIASNLDFVFPGFEVVGSYNIKISRDADIFIEEEIVKGNDLVETIIKKVKKRKIGDLSRFVYDRTISPECLSYICEVFNIRTEDLVPDNMHLNMEDLVELPNPVSKELAARPFVPLKIKAIEESGHLLDLISKRDVFLHYPYHTFNYFLQFLTEAANDPKVESIKVTQYRVAQDSEVISRLIYAARRGKQVTVFVELKARFDEVNNLYSAEEMRQAGIRIIYSLPGLKVHAKIALVSEKKGRRGKRKGYAYLSTGNFNEKTAQVYSDMAIMTTKRELTDEIAEVFDVLEGIQTRPEFKHLLVAQFKLVDHLKAKIDREIDNVKKGKTGYIILKMNGLQDKEMIEKLYEASQAGVKIDLIIRGICCLVPNQTYSQNIRVVRIVDMFLEHSRIWYFYNDGKDELYLTSADWLRRNLHRRIETSFPIYDQKIKKTILQILNIQLNDNVKACYIDEHLNNVFKKASPTDPMIWAQKEIYQLLAQ